MQDCVRCPYSRECHDDFYLLETGDIRPFKDPPDLIDYWCIWPGCPKKWLDRKYLYGNERVSIVEILRWNYELETHKKPGLSNGIMQLFRLYSIMKDKPSLLREHISVMEAKRNNDKSKQYY